MDYAPTRETGASRRASKLDSGFGRRGKILSYHHCDKSQGILIQLIQLGARAIFQWVQRSSTLSNEIFFYHGGLAGFNILIYKNLG